MIAASDAGQVSPFITLPSSESNATAIINLNDVEVTRKTGNGTTEITMSLNQIPSEAI